jgi:hypothetical protein
MSIDMLLHHVVHILPNGDIYSSYHCQTITQILDLHYTLIEVL